MISFNDAKERAQGMLETNELADAAAANVEIVRMMGVRMIFSRLTIDVRKALNAAVKNGRLGHLKKEHLRPEAYFHPNAKANAMDERDKILRESIEAIRKVCA